MSTECYTAIFLEEDSIKFDYILKLNIFPKDFFVLVGINYNSEI